ncbi:hypothetical protein EMIHUDRAFT_424312 [Emiliania huxleyi CCMP1516]|uniref:SRCR domain-containing protein n=2 Tax=Emiliania huxleyi TaxID=2903 RepID=A0A0D3JRU4_EMIH1|nr:hypothetical protein EMIHUDRAFT_424312 [Emiliania huxleyi CCMP1516]EOD26229.1 hypothetical protein EMIHUDRAFT_424312 [Emiliania huxleyi CCMP1516]|eukprot:XP_005778658.1 hypothetical protein EMIHUDRAFT_424312 [Emiliania huxleyi CCMP1516]
MSPEAAERQLRGSREASREASRGPSRNRLGTVSEPSRNRLGTISEPSRNLPGAGASWRDGDTAPRAARFPPHLARALPPGRHARHARRAWAQHGWGGEGGARACSFEGRAGCGRGCGWTIRTPQAHFGAVVVCRLLGATTGERAHRLRHLRRRRRRRRRVPRRPAVRRWRRRAASRLGAVGEQRGQAEPLRCCCS